MKKIITSLLIILGLISLKTYAQQSENTNAPEIKFEKVMHDYGKIKKNADGNCEFAFTNTGKEPLKIISARASCGCTTPKVPTDVILPGKSSFIQVHFDTSRIGVFNKNIIVTSNAKMANIELTIKGEVLDIITSPANPNNGTSPKAQ